MNVVITMAGLGSRFKKAGYTCPKYRIEVQNKTLFAWSMLSLKGFEDIVDTYFFIVRREDKASLFIQEQCSVLGIKKYKVIEIDYLTDGQATTVTLAAEHWDAEKPLLIYNIDTYVEEYAMKSKQLKGDGFIPCFAGKGNHWSFVKLDDSGAATEVREKERISENCTVGAYYFNSAKLYMELYEEFYKDNANLEKGEKYVAPLYNQLIHKGGKVYISVLGLEKVHVLGTPEEVEFFNSHL